MSVSIIYDRIVLDQEAELTRFISNACGGRFYNVIAVWCIYTIKLTDRCVGCCLVTSLSYHASNSRFEVGCSSICLYGIFVSYIYALS